MNDTYIVANFGEIFLKGKNISFFEKKLLKNLKARLIFFNDKIIFEKTRGGSFFIKLSKDLIEDEIEQIENIVKNTFGFVNFYRAFFVKSEIEELKKTVAYLAKKQQEKKDIKTFGIAAETTEKNSILRSQKVNIEVGSAVFLALEEKNKNISVNLDNPDLKIFIKIKKDKSMIFFKKQKAVGGLPVGSVGKAVVFLSGGIDSPVAAYLAMKRGLEIIAVHFHSVPQTDEKSIEKIKEICRVLNKYQPTIKLYLIPILKVQKNIVKMATRKLSIVLQRRSFLKIGELISKKEITKAFVTGDSLGQVASQTLENLFVVSSATKQIIIRPLIAFDKEEITEIARKIKTLEISQRPHEDTCSLFVPASPETKADIFFTEKQEVLLDKSLLQEAYSDAEKIIISYEKNL